MTLDLQPEAPVPRRSHLAPPASPLTRAKIVFWNERELRAGWRLAIFFLLVVSLITMGLAILTKLLHVPPMTAGTFTPWTMLSQEVLQFVATVAAATIMGALEVRSLSTYGLPLAGAFGARFWQGAAWGIAMIAATMSLVLVFGGFSFGELALHGPAIWRYALIWGLVFVTVGLFEEFLFRGYAQFTLASGLKFWPAAAILSVLFGMVHLLNRGEDKIGALGVFVIGMFFCLTLRRTGSLWFAVGLHASFEWGETFLFSVPDSGVVAPGHLLNSSFHGPAWLTGGTVGPEASVMAFLVVGIAAVIFAWVFPPRGEQSAVPQNFPGSAHDSE
jgi:uncharacterized protein